MHTSNDHMQCPVVRRSFGNECKYPVAGNKSISRITRTKMFSSARKPFKKTGTVLKKLKNVSYQYRQIEQSQMLWRRPFFPSLFRNQFNNPKISHPRLCVTSLCVQRYLCFVLVTVRWVTAFFFTVSIINSAFSKDACQALVTKPDSCIFILVHVKIASQ